ncbi:uncharacterized protein KQ657_001472 [Scheffersomyces spartinae]|uniref:Uncharacterized protein n=1 Tax=Scheffersomyces spartinae TaxID=45513 RepID=A0A9P7V7K0_9ASCO|nr:uncharacterized protein KQ657_001472 [Scheffersomyces spartinae]KAG7192691.1 hypothetical protein KQ657_001472 [Scheffersomyces spartinae]
MISITKQVLKTRPSIRSYATTVTTASPKKVGAFRGIFIGFLTGVTVTGGASYYYLFDEYKNANSVIVTDVVALQNSIAALEKHVKSLEEKK